MRKILFVGNVKLSGRYVPGGVPSN